MSTPPTFAIRDDDTSYFTHPQELEAVYGPYWGSVPISLAVVPFSVPAHNGHSFAPELPDDTRCALDGNDRLVSYLRDRLERREIEIMLHGYDHRYRRVNGRSVGEYGWREERELVLLTAEGKAYLERLLETRIRVFVPPSNTIGKGGTRAIRRAGLALSGAMGRWGDRPLSFDYLNAYARRWAWRALRGEPYPFPLRYGGHTELRAYPLTPRAELQALLRSLERCSERGSPFVLATHYWEFKVAPTMHATLSTLVARARELNYRFAPVSQCFDVPQ